ncbi:MAG TPA: endolytic transglycosylase MltG, partial [Dokdonella sp.]|nr:endolytic transglycosylase MltG [Dokdonella sp.]
ELVRQLRREGITRASPFYWRLLAREMGVSSRLQAGEYALKPGTTPRELLATMAFGRVIQHSFTIVDGWTFRQLRLALGAEGGLEQTLPGLDDSTVAARLGIDGSPEGWFLPETYAWVKGEADIDVLRRAHAATRATLDALWPARDPGSPLASPYEALILASIIEKETGIAEERAEISGVFARRLRLGMRLQTDPSVVYGLGETWDGNIRRRDLDTDTPYNTYTRAGLPPTPIALAGAKAIEAALHPAGGNALYFVAVGDGSGRHVFSATLAEHNRAVAEYLRRIRR